MRKFRQRLGPTPVKIEVWILSSSFGWKDEVRQGKRLGSWQVTVGMPISWEFKHRKDQRSDIKSVDHSSGDIWKLLKTYRILQVQERYLLGGWIQVFPPIPTFARNDWRCFTEAYSDSDLSAGCLPKQLECCFSNVFCFVLYLFRIQNWWIDRRLQNPILPLQSLLEHVLKNAILQYSLLPFAACHWSLGGYGFGGYNKQRENGAQLLGDFSRRHISIWEVAFLGAKTEKFW